MGRTAPQSGGCASAVVWWTRPRAGGTRKRAGAGVIGRRAAPVASGGGPPRWGVGRAPGGDGSLRGRWSADGQRIHAEGVPGVGVRHGEHERPARGEGAQRVLVGVRIVCPRAQVCVRARNVGASDSERRVSEVKGVRGRGQQPGKAVSLRAEPASGEARGAAPVGGEQDLAEAAEVVGGRLTAEGYGRPHRSTCRGRRGERQHGRAHRACSRADSLAAMSWVNWMEYSSTCAGVSTSTVSQVPPSS